MRISHSGEKTSYEGGILEIMFCKILMFMWSLRRDNPGHPLAHRPHILVPLDSKDLQ